MMKLTFAFILIAIAAVCGDIASESEGNELFKSYLKLFGVKVEEYQRNEAKRNFLRNYFDVRSNRYQGWEWHEPIECGSNSLTRKKINQYLHLSDYECSRLQKLNEKRRVIAKRAATDTSPSSFVLPENFNWVDNGVVRPVQNQGLCLSSYAFAAVGAIEGQLSLLGNNTKLSEQEVVDCARHYLFFFIPVVLGCNGGDDTAVYGYAWKHNGLTAAESYPYQGKVNSCQTNRVKVQGSRVRSFIDVPADEEIMKQVLYTRGPLYVTLYASPAFASYSGGIYSDSRGDCAGMQSNHAALLVGYGEESGQKYWILKNSWGEGFGEGGYVRVSRGVNLCNIAEEASYPNLY